MFRFWGIVFRIWLPATPYETLYPKNQTRSRSMQVHAVWMQAAKKMHKLPQQLFSQPEYRRPLLPQPEIRLLYRAELTAYSFNGLNHAAQKIKNR